MAKVRGIINPPANGTPTAPEPRIIRRAETAHRLGCSVRLVDRLAADGILPKRHLPNRQRAAGFLESDVNALIAGRKA
jgi:predicted DNA-binding transcriptional regulator AlpA